MGGSTISTSDTRIEALSLQSSAYGVPLQVLYGTNRVKGNLVWYGGFKATPVTTTQSSGGKGGSVKQSNTTYNYTASVIMGLCEGQISGVPRAWKGKQLYSGGSSPTSFATAVETYAVPATGPMAYTVTHSAAWLSIVGVTRPYSYTTSNGVADNVINTSQPLANGTDFTAAAGVVTILNPALRGVTVTITYQWASVALTQTALQQLGLTFGTGGLGQAVWSPLTTIAPAQALGYSGLGYVAGQDYPLGTSAQVDNHSFEVQGPHAYSISTSIPDADPALASFDLISNGRFGANFPSSQLAGVNDWSTYCRAAGLLMSPLLETQVAAGDYLTQIAKLTNTAPVWSNGRLKMIPFGDTAMTANGVTFTPNVTPIYDLTDDDFTPSQGAEPIQVTRKSQADSYNTVRIEFLNRGNLYNIEVAEAKDSANIDLYGARVMETIEAHWICDAAVARTVAQLMLQRVLYVRNTYAFTLSWSKVFLEPMDLVTLTDSALGFNKLPVRITSVQESESGDLVFEAEDFPLGTANAAAYQSQLGSGYQHDYNVAPGSVSAPTIFEAPGALTVNGLEVYVAASSSNANWGGANLWVSLDGVTYKKAGALYGGSRYGTLSASATTTSTISVALVSGALAGGSAADAAALNTLCYVGGANKEYFAYQTATLTSALHYDLGSNVRGSYGSPAAPHSSGDAFVRLDSAIAKSGPIDLSYVGKTIHIKLTSFNVYGGAEESLASVTDYTYAITGWQVLGNAGAAAVAGLTTIASDNVLSAGEKPAVILDVAAINGDVSGLDSAATAYGVTTEKTAYDNAVSALTTYLAGLTSPTAWNNVAGDTTIVGTTFRSNFTAVYAAKQALVNKLTAVAGTIANWNTVANIPLDTSNMVRTPTFEGLTTVRTWNFGTVATVTGQAFTKALSTSVRDTLESNVIPVREGETLWISADMNASAANYALNFGMAFLNAAGSVVSFTPVIGLAALAAGWQRLSGSVTVPTGVNAVSFQPWIQINGSSGFGTGLVSNMYIGRAQPGATLGATWGTNIAGPNMPANNATADIRLVGRNVSVIGNTLIPNAACTAWGLGDAYSIDGYTGGSFASLVAPTGAVDAMFGLNSDPLTDESYASIDYAMYIASSSNQLIAYASGTSLGTIGTWAAGDVLALVYDGQSVKWYQNGNVMKTVSAPGALKFFFDSAFNGNGAAWVFPNARFGPYSPTNIGALQAATQGAALNSDPSFQDITAGTTGGTAAIVQLTDGVAGVNALQLSGSSYYGSRTFPAQAGKKYRASVWCRWSTTGTNTLYLRMHCFNQAGTDLGYVLTPAIESVATSNTWTRFQGLMSPPAGTVLALVSIDSNYTGTGVHQFQDLRCEEVINTDLLADNAVTGTTTYSDAAGVTVCPSC